MKNRLSPKMKSYRKATLGSVATMAAGGYAQAEVIFFNVDISQNFGYSETLNFGSINLGDGTFELNGTNGPSFGLNFYTDAYGFSELTTLEKSVEWGIDGYNDVLRLDTGQAISDTSATWGNDSVVRKSLLWNYDDGFVLFYSGGAWSVISDEQKIGYAPLRIDAGDGHYNYGWVEIQVVAGNTNTISFPNNIEVTVTGFAFESTVNTAINAGVVPEPSSMALIALGGLFGLAARRRLSQDAGPYMPAKLMHLASGARGVERMRADDAA
ncbi:MAG: PEP-CTERM sorting domain-containing protein [Kiritimatiellia bacterium]